MVNSTTVDKFPFGLDSAQIDSMYSIANRALAQTCYMVWEANHRDDHAATDPKVGGHAAACASSLHLTTAMHMVARAPQDFWCGKPHMAPLDHSLHHQIGMFRAQDGGWMAENDAQTLMSRLRQFSADDSPTFQSYHAASDADYWRVLPSGTVGIPPVNSGYLALMHNYLVDRKLQDKKDVHFWSLLGDSEFREGSLFEAITDFGERRLSNVTWILDYNRQSLDGTRLINNDAFGGTDADRINATMVANGWNVIELKHGAKRRAAFAAKGGKSLQNIFDNLLSDFDFQAMLWKRDASLIRLEFIERDSKVKSVLDNFSDEHLLEIYQDLGGHNLVDILDAYQQCRISDKPTMVIAHTIKGFNMDNFAMQGNHSSLPSEGEIDTMLEGQGLTRDQPYGLVGNWSATGPERSMLEKRGEFMRNGIENEEQVVADKAAGYSEIFSEPLPADFGINISMMPIVHTQWMWGQVANKMTRIGSHADFKKAGAEGLPELSDAEKSWEAAAQLALTMSPDVGTSTNINPSMDGKVYGESGVRDWESELKWEERGRPELYDTTDPTSRHIRFEISEQAAMSAVGSFGMASKLFGTPLMPMMTVYDFFIKRALDQLYYNVYWRSSFLLIGTPSGVALSPEGAQHSWKSDIQMPSMVTWEPCFAKEMEWILADAMQRHVSNDNIDREGVVVRAVTMGVRQKEFQTRIAAQQQYKDMSESDMYEAVRTDVLAGGYWLANHEGAADYQPGENVVTIIAMGVMGTEAIAAADVLLERGIYANVLMCTSAELLLGRFAEDNDYTQLTKLGVNGDVHLVATAGEQLDAADILLLGARKVPIVSIADGELGLLDNAGSIVGTKQISLGVSKFSKSGRPSEVFAYHGLDANSIVDAAGKALSMSTLTKVKVSPQTLKQVEEQGRVTPPTSSWRDFWPDL
ncbi:MAG: pyruvate dehydrogenase [Planctomycetota bacterium]|nr:pyruvate dehydrogenase [Planctomycetota bacterium]